MKPTYILSRCAVLAICFLLLGSHMSIAQFSFRDRINVINMIPNAQSGETWQDSEPNIAVDPSNTNRIVASAFTRNPNLTNTTVAPIYISTDQGNTWALNNIVPSGAAGFSTSAITGDISLKFNDSGGRLYTGILRGGTATRTMDILTANNPFANAQMNVVSTRLQPDQPWVKVKSTIISGANQDRVYVSNNDLGVANSQTATIDISANGLLNPPNFNVTRIEFRNPTGQDSPPIRTAVHADGTVYGIYFSRTSRTGINRIGDVVVVRDDNWGTGTNPFQNLLDPNDNVAGIRVNQNSNMPFTNNGLGSERIGGHLAIAVDPTNSQIVYIVWADRIGTNDYTLRVRRSANGGANWSGDLLTITNALNPALAINSDGDVGFLYQALVNSGTNQNWETHFRKSTNNGSSWNDNTLAIFRDASITPIFNPYIGDYTDLMAVGKTFYGVFSSGNVPNNANFPRGVTYQRNANFATNTLTDATGGVVAASIDPFFFRVSEFYIELPPDFGVIDICRRFPRLCRPVTICDRFPQLCKEPIFEPGRIIVECDEFPCRFIDPIPKNCLVKFDCPGCEGNTVLCPPYHHIYIEEFDPRIWDVELTLKNGDEVKYSLNRIENGVVISFRPSERRFKQSGLNEWHMCLDFLH